MKKGKDLEIPFIRFWDKTMKNAFGEDKPLKYKDRSKFSKDLFFKTFDNKKIVSIGRLIPIKLEFDKKRYSILGFADLVSIVKKKGYGKLLVTKIKDYAKKRNKTIIGFCEKHNKKFYEKCGFKLNKRLLKRFKYKNSVNKEEDYVVYLEGKDKLITKMLKKPKLNIEVPRDFW